MSTVAERKMDFRRHLVDGNLELAEKFWHLAGSRREHAGMLAVLNELSVDGYQDLDDLTHRLRARYLASAKAKRCRP